MPRLIASAVVGAALLGSACTAPAPHQTVAPTAPASVAPASVPPSVAPTTSAPPTARPTAATTPGPTQSATALATPAETVFPAGSVIVTFAVVGEQFRVLLTDPEDILIARALLAGEEVPPIPNGLIIYGDPGVNAPWSWQLDPESIEFADITIEVCDGLPSYVEEGIVTSDRFCPWSAQVVSVEPAL